jgi:hypothetical protein
MELEETILKSIASPGQKCLKGYSILRSLKARNMTKSNSSVRRNLDTASINAVAPLLRLIAKGKISDVRVQGLVSKYFECMRSRLRDNGSLYTIWWAKDMYYIASRIALGLDVNPEALKVPCGKIKARKRVKFLLTLLESKDPDLIRLALSILSKGREFLINLPFDPSTIVAPYSGVIDLDRIAESPKFERTVRYFQKVVARAKPLSDFVLRGQNRFPISAKAGPNGPASISWGRDVFALKLRASSRSLYRRILELGDITCPVREEFKELWSYVADSDYIMDYLEERKSYSRIRQFPEKFGKQRVIAILDLFTQSVCLPIHQYLMNILRLFRADGTFDQNSMVKRVQAWTLEDEQLFSFDLSAATDRLPVALQEKVLASLLGAQPWPEWLKGNPVLVATLWRSVLTKRYFEGPSKEWLRYAVGQPMGAYSSWPALAVTHHFIIHWAGMRTSMTWTQVSNNYVVLGDDVVIRGSDLARQYQLLMTELGVDISISKSVVGVGVAEIAKRLLIKGQDISPVSWTLMELSNKQLLFAPSLYHHLCDRGILQPKDPEVVEIFAKVMGKPVILQILLTCPIWWNSNSPWWERFSDGDYRRFLEKVVSKSAEYVFPMSSTIQYLDNRYPTVEIGDDGEIVAPWYKPGWFVLDSLRKAILSPISAVTLEELLLFKEQCESLKVLDQKVRPVRDPYLSMDLLMSSFVLRMYRWLYPKAELFEVV